MAFDTISTYCDAVCAMIRQKRVHKAVTAELTGHMEDHADYLVETRGLTPHAARREAVRTMGDPYELGNALDRLHNPWYPRLSRAFLLLGLLFILIAAFIGAGDGTFRGIRYAPLADPAEVAAGLADGELGEQIVAVGTAQGGGKLGFYHFSDTGAAVLIRETRDYNGEPIERYRLEVVFSSLRWPIWMGPLDGSYLPRELRTGGEDGGYFSLYFLSERGLFRQFYLARVYDADPAAAYLLEFGGDHAVVYSVALKGVEGP